MEDRTLEASAKLDNPDLLYHQIKECLSSKDAEGLTTYVLERKYSDQTIFFDVASDIVQCLTQANLEENPGFFETCERCLKYLVQTGKPRLLLLAILENWGYLVDDTQFKSVLGPLRDCLLAFPKPCQVSLKDSVQAVYSYVSQIKLPKDNILDGDEKQLLDCDLTVIRLMDLSLAMLSFLEPFVEAASSVKDASGRRQSLPHQATILSKHLLLLLNRPLIYMDLAPPDVAKKMRAKTESRVCAESAVSYLEKLNVNFFSLVEQTVANNMNRERKKNEKEKNGLDIGQENKEESDDDDDDEVNISNLSISCLLYLVFTEHQGLDSVPWVYSPHHILEFCLPYIIYLLDRTEFLILYKGVHLLITCLQNIESSSLSIFYLEDEIYVQLLSKLTRVMVYCPVADLRKLSVNVFTDMIKKFECPGRCRLYECMFATFDNPGILGYCIQLLKEELNVCLQSESVDNQIFLGNKLHKLLRLILHLPNAETTDLLQNSDRIISAMNFVRYLALRDPPHLNVTGFWTLLPEVEKKFLTPMQTAVDMSRAHYKLELKNMKNRESQPQEEKGPEVTVSIRNQQTPNMPPERQEKDINVALNMFDVMESLMCRIREIFQQQQQMTDS